MDSIEMRGIDTIIPPKNVFFFAISETITMMTDEMKSLIMVCSIVSFTLCIETVNNVQFIRPRFFTYSNQEPGFSLDFSFFFLSLYSSCAASKGASILKTKSSAKKRFKISAKGKVITAQAGKRHGMIKRTNSQIRKQRGTTIMSKQDGKIVKSYMPYSLRG